MPQLSNKIWNQDLYNSCDEPWFLCIRNQTKTYEARLEKGEWKDITVGDTIIFERDDEFVCTWVTEIKYFPNFEEAFLELGQALVPLANITVEEVVGMYSRYYNNDDIDKYSVIAMGLQYNALY